MPQGFRVKFTWIHSRGKAGRDAMPSCNRTTSPHATRGKLALEPHSKYPGLQLRS
jgi:hypothetical protein